MIFFHCFFYRLNIITIRNCAPQRCFDPSKQGQAGFGVGLPTVPGDELAFQSGKEAYGHRVVVRITDRSDGRAHTLFLAAVAKRNTDSDYLHRSGCEVIKTRNATVRYTTLTTHSEFGILTARK